MTPTGERPPMELRGLRRAGEVLAAVLVLEGASRDELKRASALGAMMADRCLLVAVDGGLRTCLAGSRHPDLLVGDGDSLRRRPPADIRAVQLPREKDSSDLAGAIEVVRARKAQIVFVAGLAGGRLDHEWANLFELAAHARGFASMIAPTSRGTVIVTRHGCRTATVQGRLVSLFSIGRPAVVTLRGTRWELQRRRLRPGSHGLSNVTGTELDLTVHAGVVAIVMVPLRRRRTRATARGGEGSRS